MGPVEAKYTSKVSPANCDCETHGRLLNNKTYSHNDSIPHAQIVDDMWGSRPIAKFKVGSNATIMDDNAATTPFSALLLVSNYPTS